VQWLTAGKGIVHSEMFPLLNQTGPNPAELFQIWLNLPKAGKMVEPYFSMLWADAIPRHVAPGVEVTIIAGGLEGITPLAPPPDSWASRSDANVAIWTIKLAPNARWTLPPTTKGTNRALYFFAGSRATVGDTSLRDKAGVQLRAEASPVINAGPDGAELLLLQGRPIGEPVVQYGPFVMNTQAEIQQAFQDYRRTQFGGWPWPQMDPVHGRDEGRFARHADGRIERPVGPSPISSTTIAPSGTESMIPLGSSAGSV